MYVTGADAIAPGELARGDTAGDGDLESHGMVAEAFSYLALVC